MTIPRPLKVCFVAVAPLLASACATTAMTTIQTINPANCDIQTTRTVEVNGQVTEQETYIDPNNPYAIRCGGEREDAARRLVETQIASARTENLYNIVAIGAANEIANPDSDGDFSQRLLAFLDNSNPAIAAAARTEIDSQAFTETDLRQRVARDYVTAQVSQLTHGTGAPNYVAYAALIEAYDGENTNLRVDQAFLQTTITETLGRHNRTMEEIRAGFNASQRQNTGCRKTGANVWTCGANGPS